MVATRSVGRRVGVAGVVVGLAVGVTAAPVQAMKPVQERADCIDYGAIPKAPKGAIPRDDSHVVKRDPLKIAAAKAARAAKPTGVQGPAAAIPTQPDPNFAVTVPVHFHEILKDVGSKGGGDLSEARIAAQIDALNVGYAGTGFTFELAENTETVQSQWWNFIGANGAEPRLHRGGGKEVDMKSLLASEDPGVLDVYSASLGQFLLGFAYFPSDFTDASTLDYGQLPRFFDGVVIDFRSVPQPEGNTEGDTRVFDGTYEQGDTLTHEVGHWLELYHTFQGGCDDSDDGGDQIADTPTEASPNFLCPEPGDVPRDTCPTEPGLDPVQNFMDYSFDSCLTEFTPEQAARMQFAWQTYRS